MYVWEYCILNLPYGRVDVTLRERCLRSTTVYDPQEVETPRVENAPLQMAEESSRRWRKWGCLASAGFVPKHRKERRHISRSR